MKKLLIIALLIVGCEELESLNPDVTSPTVVITYPANEPVYVERVDD